MMFIYFSNDVSFSFLTILLTSVFMTLSVKQNSVSLIDAQKDYVFLYIILFAVSKLRMVTFAETWEGQNNCASIWLPFDLGKSETHSGNEGGDVPNGVCWNFAKPSPRFQLLHYYSYLNSVSFCCTFACSFIVPLIYSVTFVKNCFVVMHARTDAYRFSSNKPPL